MTWSRFDDAYHENEKIEDAWDEERATVGLHVMATTACNRWLSDGVIRPRWITSKLPEKRERCRVLDVMVTVGLFDLLPAGTTRAARDLAGNAVQLGPFREDRYLVHDFLDRHDSSVMVKARRARDAERKARGRGSESARNPQDVRADSDGTDDGQGADSNGSPYTRGRASAGARPDPTLPDQTQNPPEPPKGGRARDKERFEEEFQAFASSVLPHLPEEGAYYGAKEAFTMLRNRGSLRPSREQVLGYLRENRPDLMEAAA